MSFARNLIKRLFPNEIITHHISDLNKQLMEQVNDKSRICISIEKENKTREYCSLTMEQLSILYQCCPIAKRSLYESIPPTKSVKIYIDYEYYMDNNLHIQNNCIGLKCCLKVLYNLLNFQDNSIYTMESYIEQIHLDHILKQFLVLDA